eukprot:9327327-Karenia_brevis.AAC.1
MDSLGRFCRSWAASRQPSVHHQQTYSAIPSFCPERKFSCMAEAKASSSPDDDDAASTSAT